MSVARKGIFHLRSTFDRDVAEDGWLLKRDLVARQGNFSLVLVDFFRHSERSVSESELELRVADCQNLGGYRHLEAIIRKPEELCDLKGFYLFSFATVVTSRSGRRFVPYAAWDEGEEKWKIHFYSLAVGFCRKFLLIGYVDAI